MEKEFIKFLEQSKVKTGKSISKRKQKPRLSKAGRQKVWPQDFVGQKHSLADIIEAKCNSGWHDDEYDAGKDW